MIAQHALIESLSSCLNEDFEISKLAAFADAHAFEIWGDNTARGEAFPVFDESDQVAAFVFPYARGVRVFPEDPVHAAPSLDPSPKFGAIYVAARPSRHPVLRVVHCLPAVLKRAMEAEAVGQSTLASDAHISRIYWLGLRGEFFELTSGAKRTLLEANSLRSLEPETVLMTPAAILEDAAAAGTKGAAKPSWPPSIPGARGGRSPELMVEEVVTEADFRRLTSPALRAIDAEKAEKGTTEKLIPLPECVPVVNWTWWCVPTAFTMATCYHDNHSKTAGGINGYGRLVGYWFDHPKSGHNVPDFIDKLIDPATGTWRTGFSSYPDFLQKTFGYTFTEREVKADAANDYAWNEIVAEIDAGRPFVWGVQDHAHCAFGYQIRTNGKFVVVHTTWGDTAEQQREEWLWNKGQGMRFIVPGGPTVGQNLVIWAPDGGETFLTNVPVNVRWYVWGTEIRKAEISISYDGGNSWTVLLNAAPCQSGWNNCDLAFPAPTDRGRIRIRGLSESGAYIAGDGSHTNFKILPGTRPATLKTFVVSTKTDSAGFFAAPHGLERFTPDGYVIRAISVAIQHVNGNWHTLELSHDVDNRFWWNSQSVAGIIKSPNFANRPVCVVLFAEAIVG